MKTYRLKNALIFPGAGRGILHKWNMLGVQSKNNNDPKEFGLMYLNKFRVSKRLRDEYLIKNTPEKLMGNFLYLGPLDAHFGHFTEECLGRLWACEPYQDKLDGLLFMQYREEVKLLPHMIEILKLFKVDTDKLRLVCQLLEVENLIVPEIGSWLGGEKKWFKGWLEKYIDVRGYKKNLPSKIIIRRSKKFLGRVAGFDYFSNILIENGFREIYPENYTINEQIEFVISARFLVWEQGSACHLLKILPILKGTSILIRRDPYQPAIENLLASKFKHLIIFRDVKALFKRDVWFAYKSRSHTIMSTLNNPERFFKFFQKNQFTGDCQFDEAVFRKIERQDLIYFFINYFFIVPLLPMIRPTLSFIRRNIPKFIWTRLLVLKKYFAISY